MLVLAVADTVTCPEALVVAVVGLNVALAPLDGPANVTTIPLTGLLPTSVTVATNGAVNCAVIFELWPEPLPTAMFLADPAEFVNVKLVLMKMPTVVWAVTVYVPTVGFAMAVTVT